MSRSDAHLDAMLRHLGAAYYESVHGQATQADVKQAMDTVRRHMDEEGAAARGNDEAAILGEDHKAEEHRIVVGVDGSEPSVAALRWAVAQAKLTGASVDAVTVWRYPAGYGWAAILDAADFENDARSSLDDALAAVSAQEPAVTVRPVVAEGIAADVLLHEAKGADLLVLGSRGRGPVTSPLLGSVGLRCLLHAHCPVLVLRDGEEGG